MKRYIVSGALIICMFLTVTACGRETEKNTAITVVATTEVAIKATENEQLVTETIVTDEVPVVNVTGDTEDHPGFVMIDVVNKKGDKTVIYKRADFNYMDSNGNIYKFNGIDSWLTNKGVEWNAVSMWGPEVVTLVDLKGETTTAYRFEDGKYMDKAQNVFLYDGMEKYTSTDGAEWNPIVYPGEDEVKLVNLRGDYETVYKLSDGRYMDNKGIVYTYNGSDVWYTNDGVEWNEAVN